jgi:hypothetical protein
MEFKDVLRERLEIEFTKRLFSMIPSKPRLFHKVYIMMCRGINLDSEKCTDFKIWLRARLRWSDSEHI